MSARRSPAARRGDAPRGVAVRVRAVLALCLLVAVMGAAPAAAQTLVEATLRTEAEERRVELPHMLGREDFDPSGSRVRYRMTVDVSDPDPDLGIHIRKMSRSGRVILNGHDLGSCGPPPLERLRCLHQPQFFGTSPDQWVVGRNVIEVEIFASYRQTNGLSTVTVGPTRDLYDGAFRPGYLMRVGTISVLNWVTLGLGLLALLCHVVLGGARLYLWYGITCLLGVLSNINILVTNPALSMYVFDWIVFSSRLCFTCTLGITCLAYFRRDRTPIVAALVVYGLAASVGLWILDLDPGMVSLFYMPLQGVAIALAIASVNWAARSRSLGDWAMASTFFVMPLAGFLDLARLRGTGTFTGVYALVYMSAITLVLIGVGLIATLARALRTTRDLSSILQRRVDIHEAELLASHQRILEMEQQRARIDERNRLLRDMHDGFLSTLSVTRVALSTGKTTLDQARHYVTECIDDLRLMLDVSAADTGVLADLMSDFLHRFERRMVSAGFEPELELRLDGLPELKSTTLLQIMRIVQEAVTNAMRHADAREIRIRAGWDPMSERLTVEVSDDGHGIANRSSSGGRGLKNMRARATALGGRLLIDSGAAGTSVRLVLEDVRSI